VAELHAARCRRSASCSSTLRQAGPALRVERDTPVEGRPIEGVRCRFRTCYPTEVLPLPGALNYSVKGDGSLLSLRLEMSATVTSVSWLSKLRLHFAGERYISQMLYLSCCATWKASN
jgi:type VI secretion system protein ImpG